MRKVACLPDDTRGIVSGVHIADNLSRPFVFAQIQTTGLRIPDLYSSISLTPHLHPSDGDAVPGNSHTKVDEIGTISIRVFLAKGWRRLSASGPRKYAIQDHPPAVVDERAKKMGGHCIS